jgi:hypothetical protein
MVVSSKVNKKQRQRGLSSGFGRAMASTVFGDRDRDYGSEGPEFESILSTAISGR